MVLLLAGQGPAADCGEQARIFISREHLRVDYPHKHTPDKKVHRR
jgi:hypothetical protein